MVAFESDYLQEFVDLVGRLRYTEASLYAQRNTPMFACAKAPLAPRRSFGKGGVWLAGLRQIGLTAAP